MIPLRWFSSAEPTATEEVESDSTSARHPIYRTRSLAALKVRKSIGWKIRDAVGFLEEKLGPHLKRIFPNFIAVHYGYVIGMVIIASIIMYPMKNLPYIDILFFAACASTQAGLNTVDVNNLALYQQIVIYVVSTLTTPIFIHGSICFVRLYWFERYFDGIREKSKLNFKMRRTATLAARTQSMERQRTMESSRSRRRQERTPGIDSQLMGSTSEATKESPESKTTNDSTASSDVSLPPQLPPTDYTQSKADLYNSHIDDTHHMSEPSSDDEGEPLPPQSRTIKFVSDDDDKPVGKSTPSPELEQATSNIKFGQLPKPEREDFDPKDVFMSIAMMRDKQAQQHESNENDGPAIVVHGPAERASPSRRGSSLQFELAKPKRQFLHHRKRSGLRRSFLLNKSTTLDIDEEDDGDDNVTSAAEEEEDDDGDNHLERAQSNLQLPSQNQSGGIKFTKRSNTVDVPNKKGIDFGKSPTFDKFVKRRLRRPKVLRRRASSTAIDDDSEYDETGSDDDFSEQNSLGRQMSTGYLSWVPTVGRNSTFVNLSDQQKEELGGVEYRAVKLLAKILVTYYVGFHIIAFLFLLPWILKVKKYQSVVTESGVSLSWWGFFTSASAFNDLGYTLTPDSMISFRDSPYALLVMSFFIIIGNTGFPVLLRFIIWISFKLSKDLSLLKESLGFLLDHPRRCFTLLFPSAPTWWLFFILLALNAVDLILFIILDLNAEVVKDLSTGHKILDGFFQAVSTRTAGFACIDLSKLHPAVQVSYMVMMYISVMPLAISIRRTNVYEEQSLGIYAGGDESSPADENKPTSFIGAHLRKQLSFDLWFVFLGLFIICIAEGGRIQDESQPSFDVFQCLFEVVSAYGTVGMSLGYPNTTPSFSAEFSVISKLVIIAMMIRGRHRGLPYSLDRAMMLPSAKMEKRDKYQGIHAGQRLRRAETAGTGEYPVMDFLKSAAPKVIRERLKRPSFFSAKSDANSSYRSHRRTGSTTSGVSGLSSADIQTDDVDRENAGEYLANGHGSSQPDFKAIHFNHSVDPESSHATNDHDAHARGPKDTYELDDLATNDNSVDGGPIRVAESDVNGDTIELGSRKSSIQTL
ncbi:Low-affinity potassium transport protein [Cyberlindnera fabianii]|uniref:Potassium transport protein n=1 Tax=Cyberlindnera fabianii TaxID=36022 RepID=A0A1V2LBF9_CYBFA|nr:Low-affinity potassium transport protein [Cyberlindnera fabianii]